MRLLTAALMLCFATVVTMDAFSCPDGCRQAVSPDAADQCNSSSACFLCVSGCAQSAPVMPEAPVSVVWERTDLPPEVVLFRPVPSVYHPPRIG